MESDRVLREVNAAGWKELEQFLELPLSQELVRQDRIVSTRVLSRGPFRTVVEHDKVPFPSYPFEWSSEMLRSAGQLTLELAERTLEEGFGLKDASPYNVLFRGSHPVFVDLLSFQKRSPGDPMWLPYGQFVRTFLLPLLLDHCFGVPIKSTFLSNRDGVEPDWIYAMAGPLRKLAPPVLSLATIPTLLARAAGTNTITYQARPVTRERADFTLSRLYRTTRKQMERLSRKKFRRSIWSGYDQSCPYTFPQALQKRAFVESSLRRSRPKRVLDIGCNSGNFSLLASELGAGVVAIDSDSAVVGSLWEKAHAQRADVLPLVVDIARPSPASGWRNRENESFLSRCEGYFDCVLMLGMIHHLLITERIPLESILELAAELTTDTLIIEYIGPGDPMFASLLRGRGDLYTELSQLSFEHACSRSFRIADKTELSDCGRVVYFLRKERSARAC